MQRCGVVVIIICAPTVSAPLVELADLLRHFAPVVLRVENRDPVRREGNRPAQEASLDRNRRRRHDRAQRNPPRVLSSVGLRQRHLLLPCGDAGHHPVRREPVRFDQQKLLVPPHLHRRRERGKNPRRPRCAPSAAGWRGRRRFLRPLLGHPPRPRSHRGHTHRHRPLRRQRLGRQPGELVMRRLTREMRQRHGRANGQCDRGCDRRPPTVVARNSGRSGGFHGVTLTTEDELFPCTIIKTRSSSASFPVRTSGPTFFFSFSPLPALARSRIWPRPPSSAHSSQRTPVKTDE